MNKLEKNILKHEAKKIYKANTKSLSKRQRMTFSQFFKKYCEMLKQTSEHKHEEHEHTEDFNFDEMVNMNKELELETSNLPENIEEKSEESNK